MGLWTILVNAPTFVSRKIVLYFATDTDMRRLIRPICPKTLANRSS